MVIRVMLIDDHPLVRDALVRLLSVEPDLRVVGAAADAEQAAALVPRLRPDVVVMDIELPGADGITATRGILDRHPSVKVVMLSARCSAALVRQAASAGACGYLLKGDPPHQLAEGIRAAMRGGNPMGVEVAHLCRTMGRAGARMVTEAGLWPGSAPAGGVVP